VLTLPQTKSRIQQMSNTQHSLYRVFDHKNNYIQTYTSQIAEGFKWAKDCASRMSGRVDEIRTLDGEEASMTVFSFAAKK
jgi:hypothetical protein